MMGMNKLTYDDDTMQIDFVRFITGLINELFNLPDDSTILKPVFEPKEEETLENIHEISMRYNRTPQGIKFDLIEAINDYIINELPIPTYFNIEMSYDDKFLLVKNRILERIQMRLVGLPSSIHARDCGEMEEVFKNTAIKISEEYLREYKSKDQIKTENYIKEENKKRTAENKIIEKKTRN